MSPQLKTSEIQPTRVISGSFGSNPLQDADVASELVGYAEGDEYLPWALCCRTWYDGWKGPRITAGVKKHTSSYQLRQSFEFGLQRSERVTAAAASVGRIDLLEILTADYACPLGISSYCGAARHGQLGALR